MHRQLRALIVMARPQNGLIPGIAVMTGFLYANQTVSAWTVVLSACALVMLLSMFATLQNDVVDYDIDKSNGRSDGLHGNYALPHKMVLLFMYSLLLIAGLLSVVLNDLVICALVLAMVLGAYLYNTRPIYLSRRPVASIVTLTMCMTALPYILGLLVGSQPLTVGALFLGAGLMFQRVATAVLKDYKDLKGDSMYNKRTFLIAYGFSGTRAVSLLFGVVGYVCLIAGLSFVVQDWQSILLVIILTVGAIMNLQRRLRLEVKNPAANAKIFLVVLKENTIIEMGVLLCLYILAIS